MQFVFIFPGIWNANKPYGRCLKDCPNKQTKQLDWITFPHSVAQAISDFARRCYKPYESLMSRRRKKKPSLMYSWLKNWWGRCVLGCRGKRFASALLAASVGPRLVLALIQTSRWRVRQSGITQPPLSVKYFFCNLSLSCRPSFQHHLRPSPSV